MAPDSCAQAAFLARGDQLVPGGLHRVSPSSPGPAALTVMVDWCHLLAAHTHPLVVAVCGWLLSVHCISESMLG